MNRTLCLSYIDDQREEQQGEQTVRAKASH